MDVNGRVAAWSPVQLSFTGRGHPNTDIADFHYEYDGSIVHHWETGINQRLALAGPELRAKDTEVAPTWLRPAPPQVSLRSSEISSNHATSPAWRCCRTR